MAGAADRPMGRPSWRSAATTVILLWAVTAACGAGSEAAPPDSRAPVEVSTRVERLVPEIVAAYPHDRQAFTQGLVAVGEEVLESTGLYGSSSLRRVKLATGKVLVEVVLPSRTFAEGLALVGERLVQLTWQEGKAMVWSAASFQPRGELAYEGEGWGLCFDGEHLVMSDGSETLALREPDSFGVLATVVVTREGVPQGELNELECVGPDVWANVWGSEEIVRIDRASGKVTAVVDASGLLSPAERAGTDVLNGIAYRPEKGTFLLTGKFWPKVFEVKFKPARR